MASEYKVLITWDDLQKSDSKVGITNPLEAEQKTAITNTPQQTQQTNNKSNDMMSMFKGAVAVYGFGRQIGQLAVNTQATNFNIRGETLKAERMQTSFSNTTNNIGLGIGVVGSVATMNPIVIAMTAYSLAQRAYNLSIETKQYVAQISSERYKTQYYQNRLVKDISEVR